MTFDAIQFNELLNKLDSYVNLIRRKNASTNPIIVNERKEGIIQTYNEIIAYTKEVFDTDNVTLKQTVKKNLIALRSTLKETLEILNYDVNFPEDLRIEINSNDVIQINKMSNFEYLGNVGKIIKDTYSGDPAALNAFITAIELANTATTDAQQPMLVQFIKTKLLGKAIEAIPETASTAGEIITALKNKIKPETTEVVIGRLLSLRSEKTTLKSFQEQGDNLADLLRRSYISDGIPARVAKKMATKKTVEMCRLSAKTDLVKSVLASTHFDEPKEVLAKFITESSQENTEKRILRFTSNRTRNNFRGNYRFQNNRQKFNNRNYNYRSNNQSYQNNRGNFNNRGQMTSSRTFRNQNNNNRNERHIRFMSENEVSPSYGRAPTTARMTTDTEENAIHLSNQNHEGSDQRTIRIIRK